HGDRQPPSAAGADAAVGPARRRPAGGPLLETGVGRVLVGPRPPRWRTVQVVIRNTGRYLFGSAIRNWARNFGSTAPALGSMTLLLLLMGLALLGGLVGQQIAVTEARDASILHVYLKDDADAADVASLEARLRSDRDV